MPLNVLAQRTKTCLETLHARLFPRIIRYYIPPSLETVLHFMSRPIYLIGTINTLQLFAHVALKLIMKKRGLDGALGKVYTSYH